MLRYVQTTFLIILVIAGLFWYAPNIQADVASDLQSKIDTQNTEIAKLEAEIKAYQASLSQTANQSKTLSGAIKELDITQKKLEVDIAVSEQKIKRSNLAIQQLGLQITDKNDTIGNLRKGIRKNILELQDMDSVTFTQTLLQDEPIYELWRQAGEISTVHSAIIKKAKVLATERVVLSDKKSDEEAVKTELVSLKNDLATQKRILTDNKKEKQQLLTSTKNQESTYKKLIADREKKKDAFEAEIRNYENQLKFALDPSKLPSSGVFAWPMDKIIITQRFGRTVAAQRLYASGSHNGIDLGVPVGTPIRAMAPGVVEYTSNTDLQCPKVSFGKFVFIRYDNGLFSNYGHLSEITARAGDRVTAATLVGYSGNTGYSTGPHLHVSVYAPGSVQIKTLPSKSCGGKPLTQPIAAINGYLDPLIYLPKI